MRNKPIVFLFSGQGSQYYHMGEELFLHEPIFREWMQKLDVLACDIIGESILEKLYDQGKSIGTVFKRTLYTHPAIFMLEYSLAQVVLAAGIEPDYVLGSSMGEFAAAVVAGIMPPEQALELVVKQAQIFEACCAPGGMLTILNNPHLYDDTPFLRENSQLAAINYDTSFVVASTDEQLDQIEVLLKRQQIIYQRLPVSFAFHSSFIDAAEQPFLQLLQSKTFQRPKVPYLSCVDGERATEIPTNHFWHVARNLIALPSTLRVLETRHDYLFLDLGPSGTLANFIRNTFTGSFEYLTFISPFGKELKKLERLNELSHLKTYSMRTYLTKTREKEKTMKAYLFPGQGAQRKGMGQDLFDEFNDLTQKAGEILGYSIKSLCLEDAQGHLAQTQFTQPAIFVVNALSYLKKNQTSSPPNYVLGHSVGEYTALFAAGVIDFETGLRLVKKRGELMGMATGGGMAAIMGLNDQKVEEIIRENNLKDVYLANYNSPHQIVISGSKKGVEEVESLFLEMGATHYRVLNVSGAFHTPYMAAAAEQFAAFVAQFQFGEMAIPVIANATARPYQQGQVKENIIKQITSPVRWSESIRYLLAKGVDIEEFEEIGIKGMSVVKALAMRTYNEVGPLDGAVLAAEERETLQKIRGENGQVKIETADSKQTKNPSPTPMPIITPESLGSKEFRKRYNVKYAYLTGGMYRAIASKEMIVRIGQAGLMGFFGTAGLDLLQIEEGIQYIQKALYAGQSYGMNLVANPVAPHLEEESVALYLKYGVTVVEAASYMHISPALVRYRARGLFRNSDGEVVSPNRLIAKISRPEVAEKFLSPAPENVIRKLLDTNKISPQEAVLLREIPVANDLCVEADSGGHTDQGILHALLPAIIKLRDEMQAKHGYSQKTHVGAAGGIGTPEAAAAAFILGADFVLTGSINQCTIESGANEVVKSMLQDINVQDTDYAPAGDMFEMGAKVQVLKKGVFFPARANKLYDLYRNFNSLEEIDDKTQKQLQERYFKRSFAEVYRDVKAFYPPEELEKAEQNPKRKMALMFRWYFAYSSRAALEGDMSRKVDFQIHCGPSLGAFNQWVKGTHLEDWRNRHVDEIAEKLMKETAELLNQRFHSLSTSVLETPMSGGSYGSSRSLSYTPG